MENFQISKNFLPFFSMCPGLKKNLNEDEYYFFIICQKKLAGVKFFFIVHNDDIIFLLYDTKNFRMAQKFPDSNATLLPGIFSLCNSGTNQFWLRKGYSLSVSLSVCLSVCLSPCLSVSLSVSQSFYLSVCLSVRAHQRNQPPAGEHAVLAVN